MTVAPSVEELIGLEWTIARLAADMNVFGFGPVREITTGRGVGTVGTFALHVQCPWRLTRSSTIITGRADLYAWGAKTPEPDDWSYEDGHSLQTVRLAGVLGALYGPQKAQYYQSGLSVISAVVQIATGDLTLKFNDEFELRLFPDGSVGEQWRLFASGRSRDHLVVPADEEN